MNIKSLIKTLLLISIFCGILYHNKSYSLETRDGISYEVVQGNLEVSGTASFNSDITISGSVFGTSGNGNDLNIIGDVEISNDLSFSGTNSSISVPGGIYNPEGDVRVEGGLTSEGDLLVRGDGVFTGDVEVRDLYSGTSLNIGPGVLGANLSGSTGNVGIGTTAPRDALEVNGDISMQGLTGFLRWDSRNDYGIKGAGTYDLQLIAPHDIAFGIDSDNNETIHRFLFKTNTTTPNSAGNLLMAITEAGNVGIGTTAPENKLEVNGGIQASGNYAAPAGRGLTLSSQSTYDLIQTWSNVPLYLNYLGSNNQIIMGNATNNVGIGTTAPSVKLDVIGDGSFSTDLSVGGTGYGINPKQNLLLCQSSGNVGIGTASPLEKLHIEGDGRFVTQNQHTSGTLVPSDAVLTLYNNWQSDTDERGAALVFGADYYGAGAFRSTSRAAIKGGVDTTGNTANGYLAFYTDAASADSMNERARIDTNGNIGIGTTAPNYKLHVYGTSNPSFVVEDDGGAKGFIEPIAGTDVLIGSVTNGDNLCLYAAGDKRIFVKGTDGNVGIGTTAPGEKLEIAGDLKFAQNSDRSIIGPLNQDLIINAKGNEGAEGLFFQHNGANTVTILRDGNVGIGTTAPSAKLEVSGDTSMTSDLTVGGATFQQGDLIFDTAGGGVPYGEISVKDNGNSDTVATDTPTQVLRFDTDGYSNLTTPDHTQDHITVSKTGLYLCTISLSFSGDGSVEWFFSAYKNNGATEFPNVHCNRKLGAAGDVGSTSMSGLIYLTAGDTVELWMQHSAGVNKDIDIADCTFTLVMVGG